MKGLSLSKTLTLIIAASTSLNVMACSFGMKGRFQCYKAVDKSEKTISLEVESVHIDHLKEGVEIKVAQENKPPYRRIYSLGKDSKPFTDADRDTMVDMADFYFESYTEFYEKDVTCGTYEVKINRKYFYAEPDFVGTDGKSEEKVASVVGSHVIYTHKMTDVKPDGSDAQVVRDEKHFCFRN